MTGPAVQLSVSAIEDADEGPDLMPLTLDSWVHDMETPGTGYFDQFWSREISFPQLYPGHTRS